MTTAIATANLAAPRTVSITMTAVAGTINQFYAFLDGKRVIAAAGTATPSFSGTIGDHATLKVRVWGIDGAKYKLAIDLPGTADDQSLTLALTGGYHELQISL